MYIGLMTGTSMDAMDGVLVDPYQTGRAPHLIATASEPLPPELRRTLEHLLTPEPPGDVLHALMSADESVAEVAADVALRLMRDAGVGPQRVRAIGSHGQTIRHQPDGATRYSLQIGNPSRIAERTGVTTVADFRRRDMAAGGQGAPLVPAFHAAVFQSRSQSRAVVNVGGIANITTLPKAGEVLGFDTGPGNTLMDGWAQRHLGQPMDRDGAWAASGRVDDALLERLLNDAYFERPPPKSTGRERFHLRWLDSALAATERTIPPVDVQATLCELTARSVAEAIRRHAPDTEQLLVCGGGTLNGQLMARLQRHLQPCAVTSTATCGLAPTWVEAAAFAWLAQQTLTHRPGNLTTVTGARHPVVLGGIYPA